jgi:hypothetical protein
LETLALKRKITDMLNGADDESTEFTMNQYVPETPILTTGLNPNQDRVTRMAVFDEM